MKALLHLEAWQAFECHSCGRCCRDSWHIHVEPQARPAILASQAARRCEKEGYLPLVVLPDQTALTGRREDGACVFLDGKNLCTIHGELGGSHKPLACQLYPYTLTATPDGYFASLSFACPSVVAGPAAAKLESNREELLALLAQRGRSGPLPERVELWPGQMLDWRQYRELEPALLAEFDASDPVTALLDLAVGLLRSPTRPARVRREEPFEESLLEMICASVIALWELPEAPEQRQSFSQAVLLGEPLLSHRHGIPLPAFAWGPTPSPLMLSVFERYFRNAVEGKALLAGPLLHRLLALACGYALVLYYGEAFRQACGAGEWNLDLLSRAFALVEAELVTHTASADELFTVFGNSLRQAHESESY